VSNGTSECFDRRAAIELVQHVFHQFKGAALDLRGGCEGRISADQNGSARLDMLERFVQALRAGRGGVDDQRVSPRQTGEGESGRRGLAIAFRPDGRIRVGLEGTCQGRARIALGT